VLFADRTLEDAIPHLERMRRDIEQYRMAIRGRSRPKQKEDGARLRSTDGRRGQPEGALSVTISIGAAERDDTLIRPALVIRAADEALYRAKRAGRNRLMR
jgi:PleD family two-component response regulator